MIKNALKIAISIGLLVIVVTQLNWRGVLAQAMEIAWWALPAALALQLVVWAMSNVRWWLLIRVHRLGHTYLNLLKVTFIGAFFNNLLPSSTGGDLFRIYHIYRQVHDTAVAVSPIATERVVGLITMLGLATVTIHLFGADAPLFEALSRVLAWLFGAGVLALAVVCTPAAYYAVHRALDRLSRFRVVAGLLHVTEAVHTYLRRPGLLACLVLVSLAMQGLQVAIFLILGTGLGATLAATQYLFIVPVILVAASIPVTVGGLGVREAAAITLLVAAGMPRDHAAAVALLFIPVLLLSGLPGLWFFLRMKGHQQYYSRATHTDFSETGD